MYSRFGFIGSLLLANSPYMYILTCECERTQKLMKIVCKIGGKSYKILTLIISVECSHFMPWIWIVITEKIELERNQ